MNMMGKKKIKEMDGGMRAVKRINIDTNDDGTYTIDAEPMPHMMKKGMKAETVTMWEPGKRMTASSADECCEKVMELMKLTMGKDGKPADAVAEWLESNPFKDSDEE